jgi:hypothetical protein
MSERERERERERRNKRHAVLISMQVSDEILVYNLRAVRSLSEENKR